MQTIENYQYLESRPRSNYRQMWLKSRHIRAEVLYRHTMGLEPRSPEEVADDYDLPVAAVREAVEYSLPSRWDCPVHKTLGISFIAAKTDSCW